MISNVSVLMKFLSFYAVLAAILSVVLIFLWRYFRQREERLGQRLSLGLIALLLGPLFLLASAWVDARYIEPQWIQVTKLIVKDKAFSENLKEIKIVQISDLHVREFGRTERNMIRILDRLKPDILLFTGDFVDSIGGIKPCFEVLRNLKARYGIYAILGNNEDYFFSGQRQRFVENLKRLGIHVMEHEAVRLDLENGRSFWLVGISDVYTTAASHGNEEFIHEAFKGVPQEEAKVLLIHNPNAIEDVFLRSYKPQLVLAGHTHGGQFGLEFIRKYSAFAERSKYMNGFFHVDGIPLYVNKGIGTHTRPIRFLCRPEITVISLEHKTEQ